MYFGYTIQLGILIDINQIHKRFLRFSDDIQSLPNSIQISNETIPIEKTRSGFLARIDPYVNMYGKNKQIDQILDTALTELDNLKVRPNNGMPPTLAQQGHQFFHPSHNVMAGRQRNKKNIHALFANRLIIQSKIVLVNKENKKNQLYGY